MAVKGQRKPKACAAPVGARKAVGRRVQKFGWADVAFLLTELSVLKGAHRETVRRLDGAETLLVEVYGKVTHRAPSPGPRGRVLHLVKGPA
jgi:hypothetical protein